MARVLINNEHDTLKFFERILQGLRRDKRHVIGARMILGKSPIAASTKTSHRQVYPR